MMMKDQAIRFMTEGRAAARKVAVLYVDGKDKPFHLPTKELNRKKAMKRTLDMVRQLEEQGHRVLWCFRDESVLYYGSDVKVKTVKERILEFLEWDVLLKDQHS